MNYLMLAIFVISTGIHLEASRRKDQKVRNYTKPFILLSLLGFYCFTTEKILWAMVLALIFSWIGDVFLIKKGVKWFTIGGIAFWISHIFFIISYIYDIKFANVPIAVIIALAIVFIVAVTLIFRKLKLYLPKALFYPMYLYLLVNGANTCFAVFRFLSNPSLLTGLTFIGGILFFISDSSLFFVRFNKDGKLKTHFLVMLTYSIGEFLIVLGMI